MDGQETNSSIASTSLWLLAILITGVICFFVGRNSNPPAAITDEPQKNVLADNSLPTQIPTEPPPDLTKACEKTGASEKKDYLKSYILKEGDTVNSIAKNELGDTTHNTLS